MALTLDENSWAAHTAPEVGAIGDEDGSVLVVPVGSIEQHGEHLPVATDTLLVDAVAHEAADRVADDLPVLVTPPVWSGHSPHHMPFGGTLTVPFDDLLDLLEDVADAALENGFDALLFLNGHGGNKDLIGAATSTVGDAHRDAEVLGLTYFELANAFIDEVRESDVGGMAHGGEFETSMMMHLHPDLVHEEEMPATPMDEPYERGGKDLLEGGPLGVYRTFTEYSASGAIGEPALASPGKGATILERLGDELEDVLRNVHEHNH